MIIEFVACLRKSSPTLETPLERTAIIFPSQISANPRRWHPAQTGVDLLQHTSKISPPRKIKPGDLLHVVNLTAFHSFLLCVGTFASNSYVGDWRCTRVKLMTSEILG
jgi:hypothetical protein